MKLKSRILAEVPGLDKDLIKSRIQAAIKIRDWVANHVHHTKKWLDITEQIPDFYKKSADELTHIFENDVGGILCGGMAHYCAQIYRLFDYEAQTYNCGVAGVWSHQFTLVAIKQGLWRHWYPQDPMFNMHYESKKDKPLTLKQLLALIRRKKFEEIRPKTLPLHGRKFFSDPALKSNGKKYLFDAKDKVVYQDDFSLDGFIRGTPRRESLIKHFGDTDVFHCFLRLLSCKA